ncbi:hypothetical protein M422DRAFT_53381 [Sphaerobolus stellatus SS14]|uniref:Uncharacterized protein n=1 Tax=Sphaerobolus stellatus (strain SS14) TaxID=990650 RepID=A0A0C9UA98_SPHS4|nr:hypothetical protein M422DRAFT_53381 [Sphaerobolus stellatus SS14]
MTCMLYETLRLPGEIDILCPNSSWDEEELKFKLIEKNTISIYSHRVVPQVPRSWPYGTLMRKPIHEWAYHSKAPKESRHRENLPKDVKDIDDLLVVACLRKLCPREETCLPEAFVSQVDLHVIRYVARRFVSRPARTGLGLSVGAVDPSLLKIKGFSNSDNSELYLSMTEMVLNISLWLP